MTTPTTPPSGSASPTPPVPDESAEFAPRTRKTLSIMISAVLIVIFGGIATYVVVRVLHPAAPAFSAGDCVRVVEGGRYDAEVQKVDCGERAARYEVGLYLDGSVSCPADSYSTVQRTGGRHPEFTLCLMLNAAEGDCFAVPVDAPGTTEKVACTSAEADLTVTAVLDGMVDESACAPDAVEHARAYPEPRRTVCLGPVPALSRLGRRGD